MNEKLIKFKYDQFLTVIVIFSILTIIRFVGEVVEPIWFPLLILYGITPFLIVYRNKRELIGIKKPSNIKYIVIGSFFAISIKTITIILLYHFFKEGNLNWMNNIRESYLNISEMPKGVIFIVLMFTIGVPIAEEFFFRMTQAVSKTKMSSFKAILLVSALFAFSHIDSYLIPFSIYGMLLRVFPIFLYGFVHAWVFEKTKSTFSTIITHLIGNGVEAIILLLII